MDLAESREIWCNWKTSVYDKIKTEYDLSGNFKRFGKDFIWNGIRDIDNRYIGGIRTYKRTELGTVFFLWNWKWYWIWDETSNHLNLSKKKFLVRNHYGILDGTGISDINIWRICLITGKNLWIWKGSGRKLRWIPSTLWQEGPIHPHFKFQFALLSSALKSLKGRA